jgi:hypothetical protein
VQQAGCAQIAVKGTAMSSQLHFDVFVRYEPIAGQMAPVGQGEATPAATCVSLISGEHDAVVIDADLAPTDCGAVVSSVRATGKNLTTIYITPGHGDHFPGRSRRSSPRSPPPRPARWPGIRLARSARAGQPRPDAVLGSDVPGQIPGQPAVPAAVESTVVDLEGHELSVISVGQSDTDPCTIACISSPNAAIAGDAAHNGNQSLSDSRSACELADTMTAVPGGPGNPYTLRTGRLRAGTKKHRQEHADDPAASQCGRDRGTGRKVSQMAAMRQLTSGGYLVKVSETELALIKTALEQTERVSRFGMEVLDGADQDRHGRRVENTRLRRQIEALAMREASLRSLQETMAEAYRCEEVA